MQKFACLLLAVALGCAFTGCAALPQSQGAPEGGAVFPPAVEGGEEKPSVTPGEERDDSPEIDLDRDFSAEYEVVTAPLVSAATSILQDLTDNGQIDLGGLRRPRLAKIRYCYGTSLEFIIRGQVLTAESKTVSEFLEREVGFSLQDFGSEKRYRSYSDFIHAERVYKKYAKYIEMTLPKAQQAADDLMTEYSRFKTGPIRLKTLRYGNKLTVKKGSAQKEYTAICGHIERTIAAVPKETMPLPVREITGRDIAIAFGGYIYDPVVYSVITVTVEIDNSPYMFYDMPFNRDGRFTETYINRFFGTIRTGYLGPEDQAVENEEYGSFLQALSIESMDLSLAKFHPAGLNWGDGEDTIVAFGQPVWLG